MLTFLLLTLLQLNHIDYPLEVFQYPAKEKQAVIQFLLESEYEPLHRINRVLPPIKDSDFIFPNINVTAKSAAVIDSLSGHVLWQKNPEIILPIASLTKLMTAIVFLETNPDFSQEITVEKDDNSDVPGSRLYVKTGETVTVENLFYSSLVGSANNATKALARSTGMSKEDFLGRMNAKAKDLGLVNTTFFDVTGLNPNNSSTVLEYSRVAAYAFRNSKIREALNTSEYKFETVDKKIAHRIENTNKLLSDSELQLIGAKTGYLHEAGHTFVSQATQNGREITVVLFRSNSSSERFAETKSLIAWAYNNFKWF